MHVRPSAFAVHAALTVLLCLLCTSVLRATTLAEQTTICPACKSEFTADALTPTSTAGSDTDLMPFYLGAPAFEATAVTCPKCLYSGYAADFGKEVVLTDAQKTALQSLIKPIRPIGNVTSPRQIPSAVRFDLIAQTFEVLKRPAGDIAYALLQASWAERLDYDATSQLPAALAGRVREQQIQIREKLPAVGRDLSGAQRQLERARQYLSAADHLNGEARLAALLAALQRFRERGDADKATSALDRLRGLADAPTLEVLARDTRDSLTRESAFQKRAIPLFVQAASEPAKVAAGGAEPPAPGVYLYLAGELSRRTGDPFKAREYFDASLKAQHPDWLPDLANSQTKLLLAR